MYFVNLAELEAISNTLEERSTKFNAATDALIEAKEAFDSFRNELNSKYENSELQDQVCQKKSGAFCNQNIGIYLYNTITQLKSSKE